jgi:hypothetical protein
MILHSTIKSLLIPFILAGSIALVFADEQTDQAVSAAKTWLGLVDAKQYKESWVEAAPFFKEKVKEEDWVKMVSAVRGPLGDMKSRELIGAQYTKNLPGAAAGEYVVMQFKTAFQNKPEAVETVTPMKDDKGAWRVSGYFIK